MKGHENLGQKMIYFLVYHLVYHLGLLKDVSLDWLFSDGVDFLVEDPVRGDLLPDEIQTVENLDGKYEDGELKG